MRLHSTVHDCLYVNWELDPEAAPELANDLRYDTRQVGDCERCFASLLLFRQRGLQLVSLPWPPLTHAQANLRLYVIDAEGSPAVLFVAIWVPAWMSGLMRAFGRVPATSAGLTFPGGPVLPEASGHWRIDCGDRFEVSVQPGATAGRRIGSWRQTVDFFRLRETGYIATRAGLRRVRAAQPEAEATPVTVKIDDASLINAALGGALADAQVQSAFLCEKLPFEFELSSHEVPSGVPQAG